MSNQSEEIVRYVLRRNDTREYWSRYREWGTIDKARLYLRTCDVKNSINEQQKSRFIKRDGFTMSETFDKAGWTALAVQLEVITVKFKE